MESCTVKDNHLQDVQYLTYGKRALVLCNKGLCCPPWVSVVGMDVASAGQWMGDDAFFTCRKNVLLAKSPTAQVGGISSVPSRRSVPEEEEALLQQQLEEEAGGLHSSESALAVGKVSATLTSDWLEGSELLMTSLSNLNVASEVTWCSDQQHDELHTLMSLGPKEHVAVTLAKLPEEESVAMVGIAAWSAVRTQTDHQISGCTPSALEREDEDTAVLGWSLVHDTEIVPEEVTAWPVYDTGQFQPFPAESSYHEILWRDWEDLCIQLAVPELGSENGPLFEFRVMSYNILAQDLVEQSPDLYLHCQPDILDWSYRLPNLLQEIQHWDPDVLCLQEVQENHYWEQLEPTFRMMGFWTGRLLPSAAPVEAADPTLAQQSGYNGQLSICLSLPDKEISSSQPGFLPSSCTCWKLNVPQYFTYRSHIWDRQKYSRDFLLQFRFCDAACERPAHLILWKGVTDVKPDRPAHWPKHLTIVNDPDPERFFPRSPGVIRHGLNLTSAYSHFLPQRGRPEVTTMPMGLGTTVDYIFYSAEPIENGNERGRRLYRDGALKLLGRLSLLSEDVLWLANGLPNPFCSSDHLCLLASFGLEISSA
ncbi:protein angel homolog 1 isoform X6 [Mauremys reevesii]|uniref:protein angel homolog 1 isoform X6 n=1 Tax=Mauremys reevesii TaxID=260615 RepID=UPI00193FA4D5|nr:protein angel homolog 1 isoform X6 [Mauremys reevesii]